MWRNDKAVKRLSVLIHSDQEMKNASDQKTRVSPIKRRITPPILKVNNLTMKDRMKTNKAKRVMKKKMTSSKRRQ